MIRGRILWKRGHRAENEECRRPFGSVIWVLWLEGLVQGPVGMWGYGNLRKGSMDWG